MLGGRTAAAVLAAATKQQSESASDVVARDSEYDEQYAEELEETMNNNFYTREQEAEREAEEEAVTPLGTADIDAIQLDGRVVLKIIKHCRESMPESATGPLLGLDVDGVLEVTDCFPLPSLTPENTVTAMAAAAAATLDGSDGSAAVEQLRTPEAFQQEMMKLLQEMHVDNNTVGWYQSCTDANYLSKSVLDSQVSYQKAIPNSIVLLHDPYRTRKGHLALKAFRLSPKFVELYKAGRFTASSLNEGKVNASNFMEEVPIKVHNAHLVHGFLYELREKKQMSCDLDRLYTRSTKMFEKHLTSLSEYIDQYAHEQGQYQYYLRGKQRIESAQQAALQRFRAENEQRSNAGQQPQSEEEFKKRNPVFRRKAREPNRLDSLLYQARMGVHADTITSMATQRFNKMYVLEGLNLPDSVINAEPVDNDDGVEDDE
eukprot:TRINITY_DN27076_c0_g1_i1.p2 TRINITY_DN27076_c0_g1~~TRINITY_DN27076_c0_g1_i1.p2  ORF type:complete len:431 (-),score=275.54 TRINITY_DN27076_c0_g1_i1:74-1366(-)